MKYNTPSFAKREPKLKMPTSGKFNPISCFTSEAINVINSNYSFVFNNNVATVLSSSLCSGLNSKMNLHTLSATLSVDNFEIESIVISPNPVQNILNIETQETIKEVCVYNLLGEKVSVNQISTVSLDVSNLSQGMYVIKVIGENDRILSSKFIKE